MKFIGGKYEKVGNNVNSMALAAEFAILDLEYLKDLCKEIKEDVDEGLFYFLVVFDYEENAVFPKTPLTALYGDEEEPQKHIKAIYQYNRINGYSVLTTYEKNKWESVAVEYKI